MLTAQMHKALVFIADHVVRHNIPPTFDQIRDGLEFGSKSTVSRLLRSLEERGYIRRLPNRARAIEILRYPDNYRPSDAVQSTTPEIRTVPVLGRIAAGSPIEAVPQLARRLTVPPEMLEAGGRHYALEVRGDSMLLAGIIDGDVVVCRQQDTARPGDIVVALVDDREVTLKRIKFPRPGVIALVPENPAHEVREFPPSRVRVQGRMVGLLRLSA